MPHVDRPSTIVRLGRVDHVAVPDGLRFGNFGEELPDRVPRELRATDKIRLFGR